MFDKGDQVVHPTRGVGVVQKRLVRGVVRVLFDDEPGLPRTLHGSGLGLVGGPPPGTEQASAEDESMNDYLSGDSPSDLYPQAVAVVQEPKPKPPKPRAAPRTRACAARRGCLAND